MESTVRMNSQPRRILPPGASRKQKEKEMSSYNSMWPSSYPVSHKATTSSKKAESAAVYSNRVLAGYMAYEFLTKGTMFGQMFDRARAEAALRNSGAADEVRRGNPAAEAEPNEVRSRTYDEVASLLKSDEAHIPGVVNPTQLARWLQM
ncbi:hypothetical protein DM860_002571 [Cuscuta australis]|uniref:Embryo sac development arrest 6 n=1 Tax=Cuscuta australis TaxID=267555 RepID=A0A328D3W5_9ASTE|nr:hypothetical protein DM860_002571 [Cuscuta australis]